MEKIVIKLEKTSKINFWIAEGGLFLFLIVLILIVLDICKEWNVTKNRDLVILAILTISGILLFILTIIIVFVSFMRAFTFTKEGCQISVLWIKKMYTWSELQTKRVVTYEYTRQEKMYKNCLELYKKKIKPLKVTPSTYCMYLHPFSFIYVYFGRKSKLGYMAKSIEESQFDWYVDTTNTLIPQLREWGVELEEITVKISGKN